MLVVRAAGPADLDGVLALAREAGPGMTTLKPDRAALAARLEIAAASFNEQVAVAQRDYVFVMEDTSCGRIAGICAIKGAAGLDEPFYNYRIGTAVHAAAPVDVPARHELLYLPRDLTGCAELCSLYLHPDYRWGINGKLLSKSRFMFIAQFPHLFPRRVFAVMRGFLRADRSSPFWDSMGQPVYVDKVPARRLLEQEGMYTASTIDIFDGGPVLQAMVHELRANRDSVLATLDGATCTVRGKVPPVLVCTTAIDDFRVVAGAVATAKGRLLAQADQRRLLGCGAGGTVRMLSLSSRAVVPAAIRR